MPAGKEIKERIKSVKNTGKITKAMELISTVKMKKSQEQVYAARPFADLASYVFSSVGMEEFVSVPEKAEKDLVVVISSQKGLCGSYNLGAYKQIVSLLQSTNNGEKIDFVTVGKKGREFLLRTGQNVILDFSPDLKNSLDYKTSKKFSKSLLALYATGAYRKILVISTYYISAIRQIPTTKTLYPLSLEEIQLYFEKIQKPLTTPKQNIEYLFEPSKQAIRDQVIPLIFEALFRELLLESQASEHASRMIAMKNAKDAANKKVGALTLSFNKARQGAITKEVSEIVSGVESMKEV